MEFDYRPTPSDSSIANDTAFPFKYTLYDTTNWIAQNQKFYVYDHLGNTRLLYHPGLVRSEGDGPFTVADTLYNVLDYFPYGKLLREYRFNDQERFLMTHQERDAETGYDNKGARCYNSGTPPFMSLDPKAMTFTAWSPYNYALDNPIKFVDPDGKGPNDPKDKNTSNPLIDFVAMILNAIADFGSSGHKNPAVGPQRFFNQNLGNGLTNLGNMALITHLSLQVPAAPTGEMNAVEQESNEVNMATTDFTDVGQAIKFYDQEIDLGARAQEIHSALDPFAQDQKTTAVGQVIDGQGNISYLVGSSDFSLPKAQRTVLNENEAAIGGEGHAETTIVNYANKNGLKVTDIGASRPICPTCAQTMQNNGINAASPVKAITKFGGSVPVKPID